MCLPTHFTGVKRLVTGNSMGYIYKITNTVNSKSYIGISVNHPIKSRGRTIAHLNGYGGNQLINDDLEIHGKNAFKVDILESNIFPEVLPDLEKFYIAKYNTVEPDGYNRTHGGERAKRPSDEVRRKQSEAKMGHTPWNKGKTGKYKFADIWDNQDEVIRLYKDEIKSSKEIADIFQVCDKTVIDVLKFNKIKLRKVKRHVSWREQDKIIHLYTVEMKPLAEIADKFKTDGQVIRRILVANNIEIRPNTDYLKGKPAHNRSEAWKHQDKIIELYTTDLLSAKKIGKKFDVNPTTILDILRLNNIELRVGHNQFGINPYSEPAKKLFLSLPASMDISEKRKIIFEKYSHLVSKAAIYAWVRKWGGASKPKKESTYDLCRQAFLSLPKTMPIPEKVKILRKKFSGTHRATIWYRVKKWQSEND